MTMTAPTVAQQLNLETAAVQYTQALVRELLGITELTTSDLNRVYRSMHQSGSYRFQLLDDLAPQISQLSGTSEDLIKATVRVYWLEQDTRATQQNWWLTAETLFVGQEDHDWEKLIDPETGQAYSSWSMMVERVSPNGWDLTQATNATNWIRHIVPRLKEMDPKYPGKILIRLRGYSLVEALLPLLRGLNDRLFRIVVTWIFDSRNKPTVRWINNLKGHFAILHHEDVIALLEAAGIDVEEFYLGPEVAVVGALSEHMLRTELRNATAEQIRDYVAGAQDLDAEEIQESLGIGEDTNRPSISNLQVGAVRAFRTENGEYRLETVIPLAEILLKRLARLGVIVYDGATEDRLY
jgi:hypothetical protein